eukprot:scaffold84691_cov54-Phaeocystis_antarctica.AAC.2
MLTCTQPSSAARVSSGPRAAPRRPPKFLELPTCLARGLVTLSYLWWDTTGDARPCSLSAAVRLPACVVGRYLLWCGMVGSYSTCLARGRSATGASSAPHASFQASSAFSSACGNSPRSTRATAAAPARRTAPALSKPARPSSGLPSRSASPNLPS